MQIREFTFGLVQSLYGALRWPAFRSLLFGVTRLGYAYKDEPYRLIEILSHKGYLLWRFLYVDPIVSPGNRVEAGQTIGTAQAISRKYGRKMTDHVHVEININPYAVLGGTDGEDDGAGGD